MKTLKCYLKVVALFFSILILLQGCTVYKSAPISIERAVQNETKVKVKTKSGEKFKFSRIGIEDGNYYGISKSKGVIVKIPLDEKSIDAVNEKDKTLSTILIIGIPIIIIVLLISSVDGRGLGGK